MILNFRLPIAVLLCLSLLSCRDKKDIPETSEVISADSLIAPGKMILILADVHVVEAAILLERNEGEGSREQSGFYYNGIYKKYHITSGRYEQSLAWYRQNPENYAKMYEKVIDLLDQRQKKINGGK
jgi:hypothetical protein